MRERFSFNSFKITYIDVSGGYTPIWCGVGETTVYIDLVCHWRLADGKVKFVQVELSEGGTAQHQQLQELRNYVTDRLNVLLGELRTSLYRDQTG